MPTISEVLAGRFPEGVAAQPAKIALTRTLAVYDDFRAQHTKIADNKNLSPIGRQDAMRKYVSEKAHELHRARKSVETMRQKLTERRAKLAPAAPDKADMSAAILRSEMRTMLRGMSTGQRMALLLSPNPDPMLLQAVLEAPDFASGMNPQTRELVTAAVIEKTHPGALAAIEQVEEAIEVVNAATRVAFDTVRAAAEFPNESTLVSFVEQSIGATGAIDADVDRSFSALAEIAA